MKTEFKVGDTVEAFGVRGIVTEIDMSCSYPIEVMFSTGGEFEVREVAK